MMRTVRMLTPALAAAFLVLLGTGRAAADPFCAPPGVVYYPAAPAVSYYAPAVSYYAPAPVVSYYSAPRVAYYPAQSVSYYAAPTVSYYAAPAVSYYAAPAVSYYAAPAVSYYAAPSAVTTTRYGLFGRPRVSTTYYP